MARLGWGTIFSDTSVTDAPTAVTPPRAVHPIRRLLALAWHYRAACLTVFTFQVVLLVLGLGGLGASGVAIDLTRHALDAAAAPARWPFGLAPPATWSVGRLLFLAGGSVLAMAAARALLMYGYSIAVGKLLQVRIVPDLRVMVFDKLQRLSFRFFDDNASGSIINRVTSDVQSVRAFVDGVVLQGGIMLLSLGVYMVYMLRAHVALTLACLAPTPLIWLVTSVFSRRTRPAYERSRQLSDDLVLALSEGVKGVRVTKIFGREAEARQRFADRNQAVRDQQESIFTRVSRFSPAVSFITAIDVAILLAYGGKLVARHDMTLGQLVVFAGVLQQFAGQVASMATIWNTLEQSLAAARRVFEILDAPIEIHSPARALAGAPEGNGQRGEVRFENVAFAYGAGRPVLEDLQFTIAPGQCVALFGPTGSGKSSLLGLLPRFYDPRRGSVLLDGVDLRQWDLAALRRRIGVVFQESLLFRSSIADNIAFGHPEASASAIEAAARNAGAHEFIAALPEGYATRLDEGGANLSGGQRQRIALARALLLDPALLLLDDPTAAVDALTEEQILASLERARGGRTVFIASNRLTATRRADLVLVLDRGRIVERGSHAELMAAEGLYFRAASLQTLDARDAGDDPEQERAS
ncbi:MAG TPA: ABC transporter ATP-binding protein [Polyangia bacterium]|nr:ABC transporter ATP-binding protein [Polyangia bacterium]